MSVPVLEVDGLNAWYGDAQILFELSLEVRKGEAVALVGPNGAGKSTTMKAVMGLVRRSARRLLFEGRDISSLPTYRIARLGIGYVPEDRRIFTDLTVAENLDIAARSSAEARDAPVWSRETLFELFPNLARMQDRRGSAMSGGEQQMLSMARALVSNPQLLILDEPSEGVAPIIVEQMIHALRALKASGLSILISEQNYAVCEALCNRSYVIEQGEMRWNGEIGDLRQRSNQSSAFSSD
ncbi:ABC transporter ATP-binding protein [Ancylobacter pratisalsi]|uniref:ABC transporter ATP-binding protein n=1 Tax=Ancylobacter pratisalsi TaxID=1745854 RepID=A0A6P1YPW8_9HYPH|nr:ABC transporter ATP-binding protein [Ancylobacter pratisalsi]QIB33764.1 ABC transporter ATP-binding protein [Ancylobacter pratisalsi]